MNVDNLKYLIEKQREFQQKLGVEFDQNYINTMCLALIDEVMESLRETPWKPWKKNQTLNHDEFKDEIVDCWHFLINLTLAANMNSDELVSRYNQKNKINHERQEHNY